MSQIAIRPAQPAGLAIAEKDRAEVLRDSYMPGASEEELKAFTAVCNRTGLDFLSREIYAVKRWDSAQKCERWAFQTGIDGYRKIAESTGAYAGQVAPQWCGEDGIWKECWLLPTPPVAARVGVLRKGFEGPQYRVALWREYVQTNREGQPTAMWRKMPTLMLAKCAEAQALRATFPAQFEGVYTEEEMGQADNEQPAPAAKTGFSTPDKQPEANALPPSFPGKVPTSLPELTQLLKAWRERDGYEGDSKPVINAVIEKTTGVAMPWSNTDAKQRQSIYAYVHDAAKSGMTLHELAKPEEKAPAIEATPEPAPEPKAEAKPKAKSSTITPDDIPF
jgi:phage recombination protein Bet